jgi:hypothetical protein
MRAQISKTQAKDQQREARHKHNISTAERVSKT